MDSLLELLTFLLIELPSRAIIYLGSSPVWIALLVVVLVILVVVLRRGRGRRR